MRLKKVFEMLFIFLLPLIILVFNFDFKKQNEYDLNNNLIRSNNYIEFKSPFSDYKDNNNIYINYLNYNQYWNNSNISLYSTTYTKNLTITDNIIKWYANVTFTSSYLGGLKTNYLVKYDNTHKYLLYFSVYSNGVGVDRFGFDRSLFLDSSLSISYTPNTTLIDYFIFTPDNSVESNILPRFGGNYAEDDLMQINFLYFVDLTQMFGYGYEPNTLDDFLQYNIELNSNYIESNIIQYNYNSIISSDWQYNFTIWGRFFNFLNEDLHITDNFILRFSVSYCMLAIINIFIWNLIFYTLTLLFKIILFKRE